MLNWNDIETVLLDMDGTLLDLHFDSYFWLEHLPKRYAEINQQPLEEVKPKIVAQIMAQQGLLTWYSLEFWNKRFNLDLVKLKQEVQHLIKYRADAKNFLQQLKLTNKKVILATNADLASLELKLPLTGLSNYLDNIYSSASFNAPKEEQGYWQQLKAKENLNPATCLLIDDNLSVLASAQKFGIGKLITISQPDTSQPPQAANINSEFPSINNFAELNLANYINHPH